jgi:hypothetical protein
MTRFGEELIDEVLGTSSKKWARLLLAVGVGAAIALWLTGRSHDQTREVTPPEPTSAEDERAPAVIPTAATKLGSAWTRISRPPAVLGGSRAHALTRRESALPAD